MQGAGIGADPWDCPQPHPPPSVAAYSPTPPTTVANFHPNHPPTTIGGGAPTGIAALGLSDATLKTSAEDLQGVVTAGLASALPSPSPASPGGKVARLSLMHLRFV